MDLINFLLFLAAAVIIRTIIYYGLMQIFDSMFGCFIIMVDFIVSLLLIFGTEVTDNPVFMIPLISLLLMFGVFGLIIVIKEKLENDGKREIFACYWVFGRNILGINIYGLFSSFR